MLNFAEAFRGKTPEPPAPGLPPSGKNRAQRRHEKRVRESRQRRGQKTFTRDQLNEQRQRLEAQRALVRAGEGRFVRWGRETVFALAGTALFEGKRIPVIAVHPEGYSTHYFDDRFGKTTKILVSPDSVPPGLQPIELDDEDSFRSRQFGGKR